MAERPAKRIEAAARRAALGLVRRMVGARELQAPDWAARMYRVLFVRHDGIGDLIMTTGTLRAIARAHPTIALDLLTHRKQAAALEGTTGVNRIIPFDPGRRWAYPPSLLRELRDVRYDAVVDGMVPRFVDGKVQRARVKGSVVQLMLASGAPYRIGMRGRPNDWVYTLPVSPPDERAMHHVEYTAALARPFGVDAHATDLSPELHVRREERAAAERLWRSLVGEAYDRPRLLVNLASANARRRWPEDRFVALLRNAADRWPQALPLVIGGPAEAEEVARIAAATGVASRVPELREAFALVNAADLLITPETSLGHAAAALRTPAIVLLPRGHEHLTPYGAEGACLFGEDGTIGSIAVAEVATALDGWLASTTERSRDRARLR